MKILRYRKTGFLFLLVLALEFTYSINVSAQTEPFNKGEILFQINSDLSQQEIINQIGKPGKLELVSKPWRIYKFIFEDSKINLRSFSSEFYNNKSISFIQLNHQLSLRELLPNDSLFNTQWALHNTGQFNGIPGADIKISNVWETVKSGLSAQNDSIVIAVVDNGFELNHPDLNFWKNYAEIPNNDIDDDKNGFIDDFDGWNCYSNNQTITSAKHGTHVSGIIAARGNNKIGVSGINWNLKIMPVQGSGTIESTVIAAYSYVFEQRKLFNDTKGLKGAFVVAINSSFGVDKGNPSNYPLWCSIYDSLGKIGILNAVATANLNYDIDAVGDIPTACPSDFLISVTNTTNQDKKFSSAAYGSTTIDIGAPGTQINSTVPNGLYAFDSGTSMASPHVAGAIGLMYAAACNDLINLYKIFPDSVTKLMKSFLLSSVDLIPDLMDKTVSGGRLNVNKAVQTLNNYCESLHNNSQTSYQLSLINLFPNPAVKNVTIKGTLPVVAESKLYFYNMLGQEVKVVDIGASSLRNFEFSIDLSDLNSGVYFVYLNQNYNNSEKIKLILK